MHDIRPVKVWDGEPCEFPNHVYRGWCRDVRGQWKAEFCYWEPNILERPFEKSELPYLKLLRWEVRHGHRYDDDLRGWVDGEPAI